eukprot:7833845-Alexandrium_andersonii.AAC.1
MVSHCGPGVERHRRLRGPPAGLGPVTGQEGAQPSATGVLLGPVGRRGQPTRARGRGQVARAWGPLSRGWRR